jgi:geranylgeranyl pyrophosphate synthase
MDEQAQVDVVEDYLRKVGTFFQTRDQYLQADTEKLETFAKLASEMVVEVKKLADMRRA